MRRSQKIETSHRGGRGWAGRGYGRGYYGHGSSGFGWGLATGLGTAATVGLLASAASAPRTEVVTLPPGSVVYASPPGTYDEYGNFIPAPGYVYPPPPVRPLPPPVRPVYAPVSRDLYASSSGGGRAGQSSLASPHSTHWARHRTVRKHTRSRSHYTPRIVVHD